MEKREPLYTVAENVSWCSHYGKQNGDSSKKNKNRITIQSSYSTSGYLSEEYKNTNSKGYMHSYVHHSMIYNSQEIWKQPNCPSRDEGIKKLCTYIHAHTQQNTTQS